MVGQKLVQETRRCSRCVQVMMMRYMSMLQQDPEYWCQPMRAAAKQGSLHTLGHHAARLLALHSHNDTAAPLPGKPAQGVHAYELQPCHSVMYRCTMRMKTSCFLGATSTGANNAHVICCVLQPNHAPLVNPTHWLANHPKCCPVRNPRLQ